MKGQVDWRPGPQAQGMRAGWVCSDLGPRQVRGTYGIVPLEALPSLGARLDGRFGWLAGPEGVSPDLPERVAACEELRTRLGALGLGLPEDLRLYLCCSAVCHQVDGESTTACWTGLSPVLRPAGHPQAACVRFLCDQQGCTAWYCWITPQDSWVVALWTRDGDAEEAMWRVVDAAEERGEISAALDMDLDAAVELVDDVVVWVAPSVEAFIYRTLLEGRAWYRLHPRWSPWARDGQAQGVAPLVPSEAEAEDYLSRMTPWPPQPPGGEAGA